MLHKRYVHTIVLSNDLQLCIWHPLQWLRPDDGFVFTNSVLHTYLISEYVECGGTGEYTEEVGSDTKRENRQEKKEQTVREEMKTQNTLKKKRKLDAKSFEKQRRRWRLQAASISNACCHNWILLCIFFFRFCCCCFVLTVDSVAFILQWITRQCIIFAFPSLSLSLGISLSPEWM